MDNEFWELVPKEKQATIKITVKDFVAEGKVVKKLK